VKGRTICWRKNECVPVKAGRARSVRSRENEGETQGGGKCKGAVGWKAPGGNRKGTERGEEGKDEGGKQWVEEGRSAGIAESEKGEIIFSKTQKNAWKFHLVSTLRKGERNAHKDCARKKKKDLSHKTRKELTKEKKKEVV